jgi:hypothetical protein
MESNPSTHDKPDLRHFYENVDETFSFLPDEAKNKLIASTMVQSVDSGNTDWLGCSPRAKKLKTIVEMSKHALESERSTLVSEAVQTYIRQKKSEENGSPTKQCLPPSEGLVPSSQPRWYQT